MDKSQIEALIQKLPTLKKEIGKVIVGQSTVIDQLIIGMIAGGHVLLEGVPGLAKTLMIRSLSEVVGVSFNRIQFTPDLMPTDILGTELLEEDDEGKRHFRFVKGPVFTNILLADEINRTPPKTQSALLQVMQEYQVTYGGQRHELPRPFFLLATQNPIEQSGTFPLPEAQVDRFLLYVQVGYPSEAEEAQILRVTTSDRSETLRPILEASDIMNLQDLCRQVTIADELVTAINRLVRSTRPAPSASTMVGKYIDWGAGPRAGQALILAAKACALLQGRYAVIPSDIRDMSFPALRHRLLLNYQANADGISTEDIIQTLLDKVNL
ncbi:MAG: MoxR family ATPase [Bacteroidota bacterium]